VRCVRCEGQGGSYYALYELFTWREGRRTVKAVRWEQRQEQWVAFSSNTWQPSRDHPPLENSDREQSHTVHPRLSKCLVPYLYLVTVQDTSGKENMVQRVNNQSMRT